MKKIFLSLIAIAALTVPAKAQTPTYAPATVGVPSPISAATNLATVLLIDARKQQNVAVATTVSSSAVQTNIWKLHPTVDGLTYDTNTVVSIVGVTHSTGASRTSITNLTANGIMGWYVVASTPYAAQATTNAFKYGVKISAP